MSRNAGELGTGNGAGRMGRQQRLKLIPAALLMAAMLGSLYSCSPRQRVAPTPLSFNGSSRELKATEVVVALDSPIPVGQNAIWCASFQSAWQALEELAGEPISFAESSEAAKSLNASADPRPHIPPESLYSAAGWNQSNIITQIQSDLKQKFPGKEPPAFPGIAPDSFVAYAYLEAEVKFPLAYDQNPRPFVFTDSRGGKAEIHSFGVLIEKHGPLDKLWDQPRVLFRKGESHKEDFEFGIDLCSNSSPSQIVVARIAREPTLAAALARVEKEIAGMPELINAETERFGGRETERLQKISPLDVLLVPDFHWAISHHFTQLEGKAFTNQRLRGQRMDIAQQDILFRLNRTGAILKSESKVAYQGFSTDFHLDRPFLIYMKKRGAPIPYFAMWVDNAELLRLWDGVEQGK